MNNPLVSILIPVYNVEAYLPKCLDTVLGQTYTNLQVVLIDDGSKDGSWIIMQDYAAKDSRIEIYHQENQGVAVTRNSLLDKIKGAYILFIDSDDWIELNMVEYLLSKLLENQSDMAVCSNVINDEQICQENTNTEIWEQDKSVYEFIRHVSFNGSLWNKLICARCLNNVQFQSGICYGEDALFCWKVLQNVYKIVITDEKLYHYRRNNAGLSLSDWQPHKKGTSHLVWDTISKDVKMSWPQYSHFADARFALEDMWALYYASLTAYPLDEEIIRRQKNIRNNFIAIVDSKLCSIKIIIMAFILSHCYSAGIVLRFYIKLLCKG